MPRWGLQVLLLIAGVLPVYGQTNFALYGEAIVSSNDSCGLQGNEEFCVAVDRRQHCHEFDYCNALCPFEENMPFSVNLVATGKFHGEVMVLKNISFIFICVMLSVKRCIIFSRCIVSR